MLFYRQVPDLARKYRVATYALREDADRMETLVRDLAEVIRTISPRGQPATLVGESFGGAVSLSLALAHPELVEALVILNSFSRFFHQARLRAAILGLHLIPWKAMGMVRWVTASRLHSPRTGAEEIRRFLELTSGLDRRGYLNRLRILTRYDVRGLLPEITAPTLFLAAEEDRFVPSVREARWMAEHVPRAQLRVLPGHGHICLIAPDFDLLDILEEWDRGRAWLSGER
ncbi:MAG: alpha/beta hydrolase [Acidobacteria bacterium]|nr:alpha/beta hydrolase [Acidobacteriota bacterium]